MYLCRKCNFVQQFSRFLVENVSKSPRIGIAASRLHILRDTAQLWSIINYHYFLRFFCLFSAKKLAFFLKANVMIQIFAKTSSILNKKTPRRLHLPELFAEEIAAGAEDDLVGGQGPVVREQVDVEEVAALAEVVEDGGREEGPAQAAALRASLYTEQKAENIGTPRI
jgi:hypothetical protein